MSATNGAVIDEIGTKISEVCDQVRHKMKATPAEILCALELAKSSIILATVIEKVRMDSHD